MRLWLMSEDEKQQLRSYVLLAAVAFLGGGGGTVFTQTLNPPRPDPFTGTQGKGLERRLQVVEYHNGRIEERLDIITERLIGIEQQLKYWNLSNGKSRTQ